MNCQEIRSSIENIIDGQLPMSRKRRIDLHLRQCAKCRAFCESERREHAAWFRALNDMSDIPQMSSGLEARFLSSVKPPKARSFGQFFKWVRRAAVFLMLAGGASYAAWIGGKANEAAAVAEEVAAKYGGQAVDFDAAECRTATYRTAGQRRRKHVLPQAASQSTLT